MRDFNKPLRKALATALDGHITYGGSNVPFFDQKVKRGENPNHYIMINNLSSTGEDTFHTWTRQMSVVLVIVTKTADTYSTSIADDIAQQIFDLLITGVGLTGLTQAHFQYLNCNLDSDSYLKLQLTPTLNEVQRLLTFSITTNQTD